MRILRGQFAFVQLHRTPRDRQAQAQAAAGAITVRIHAVERIEDPASALPLEPRVRNRER